MKGDDENVSGKDFVRYLPMRRKRSSLALGSELPINGSTTLAREINTMKVSNQWDGRDMKGRQQSLLCTNMLRQSSRKKKNVIMASHMKSWNATGESGSGSSCLCRGAHYEFGARRR